MISISLAWLANSMSSHGRTMVIGFSFVGWTILNLLLMVSYALGMQKIFLVKNMLCGFFAISPLAVGASLVGDMQLMGKDVTSKLYQLAAVGFPLQISREILKDMEDVEIDRGEKQPVFGIPISSNSFQRLISDDQVGRFLGPWSPEPGDNHWTPSHHPFIARRRNKSTHY